MFDQNIVLFSAFVLAGFFIIIIGFKFSDKTRKVIETIGAVTFHVGVFGILYHRVSLSLFISLFTLVIALFILLDPLKIATHVNVKIYKLFGYLVLCAAIAFGIEFMMGFPVWPWIIPIVIYLAPYLISPLRRFHSIILIISWILVFVYVLVIGLVIYGGFNKSFDARFITKHFHHSGYLFEQQKPIHKQLDNKIENEKIPSPIIKEQKPAVKTPLTTPATKIKQPEVSKKPLITEQPKKQTSQTQSPSSGPFLKSLQEADKDYVKLTDEHKILKNKYNDLLKKNIDLEKQLEELKDLIREHKK
ncbi:MAG: hypothetical protein ABII18_07525 [bacterium]